MKKIYSALFLMMMVATINAQPPKGMGQSDPEAKKVLDAVSAKGTIGSRKLSVVAVVAAPGNVSDGNGAVEVQGRIGIRIGSGNPAIAVSVESVVKVDRAMVRETGINEGPKIAAGKWCGALTGKCAIGWRSCANRGIEEMSVISIP